MRVFGHAEEPGEFIACKEESCAAHSARRDNVTVPNPAANITGANSGVTDAESDATASRNDYRA
jgi:hypothetical protein